MAGNLEIIKNNCIGYFDPVKCSVDKFRLWIRFLNEHSIIKDTLSLNAPLKTDPLRLVCTTSVVSNSVVTFNILNKQYQIDESVICTALNLPSGNIVSLPSDHELISFFQNINYQGQVDLTKISESNMVNEWDCFFDTLAKVFANCTKTSFHNISSLLQYIGYAVANNQRINLSQLIYNQMVRRIIIAKIDHGLGNKVQCYYPIFLTIILNHILTPEHKALFGNSAFEVSLTTHNKFYTRLSTSSKYSNVPVVVTPYMSNYIKLPTIQTPHVQPQPPVDQSTQVGSSTPLQVLPPFPETGTSEPQVGDRADQGLVVPQSLTQVIEPNTELHLSMPSHIRQKLPFKKQRSDKVGTESEPTTLPPLEKRRTLFEEFVSPSLSSQQDLDFKMANELFLDSFSQHDESIELRHRAMAPCTESIILPLLTMGEEIHIEEIQDTQEGEHMMLVTVPKIVTVEEPSQASEGKSDSSPSNSESFSPVPEGTSLAPLRDFPLANLSGESGRQLSEVIQKQIQISNQNDYIDSIGDWDSRTPSAPPLTFLEGAMMISHVGTSGNTSTGRELILSDVRQTTSNTLARKESETLLSDCEVSAYIDTNTILLAQIAALQQELETTKAENVKFKAQVVERSSSSTSVNIQLVQLKEEIQNIRTSFIPKMNSIQTSQLNDDADIAILTDSQSLISDNDIQLALLSGQMDLL